MNRLSVVDEIFLHRHRGLGLPVVMQGLWRSDDTVDLPLLISLHDALARGPLGRRVVRPRMPGARPRFEPTLESRPLHYPADPIPVDGVLAWADLQAEVDVDPQRRPGWALAAAPVAGGGTVVSLVCSHVLADARGLLDAVTGALAGTAEPPSPDHTSDVRDALHLVRQVGRGLRGVHYSPASGTAPPPRTVAARPVTALLDVDAEQWDRIAETDGGTPNALFLAVGAGIARRAGVPSPVRIAVPVGAAPDTDATANGVSTTEVVVGAADTPARIRAAAREAYRRPREGAPHGIPDEILQLMPDRLAARMAAGAGERDVLCSNIGPIPDSLTTFGPHRTTGFAARAMHPGLPAARATTSTRLSAYLCALGGHYTLALVALDGDLFPDSTALRTHADAELAARGLQARYW
ncbi:hypothetical protein [Rhodococcus phenolicus]|uniref:hypothetical protein n=1 Tax=Rhodococcus phenolicus TaxID=263849 RepID=UPI00082E0669|nr:hypothetical protein [Rhodococcus phenolicus]